MMTTSDERSFRTENISEPARNLESVCLEAIDGPGKGARRMLRVGTISIGSGADCDLVLADKSVSRQHATIELLPGAVNVRDLDSRNGTLYLGARIEQARVPLGGSIQVGRTVVSIRPATEEQPVSSKERLAGVLGRSLPTRRLFALMEKLGPTDSTVLIRGETGVGKEAVARALHQLSPRASGPFVVFECAAVNPSLLESELFGHARGAFTGADRARTGAVEAAHGGTLLLDEIGALPIELQPKLLRVVETLEVRRIGENTPRKVSVRLMATTHRDPEVEIAAGRLRSDLYFRLAVATINVLPLRQRPEDIPLLAAHFAKELTGVDVQLAPATLAAMQCDDWPGNVRELRNAVERVVALGTLNPPNPAPEVEGVGSFKEMRDKLLRQFEGDYLCALLKRHRGNVAAAAREAKLARSQFYRLLTRHNLVGKGDEL
jgi:DNA-binding NtrC family response regulator